MPCTLLAVKGRHHGWVLAGGDLGAVCQGFRNEPAWPWLDQVGRRMADHSLIGGAAGLQVGFRKIKGRNGGRSSGLGLRDVRARHLANIEAILGGPQITRQHRHVVLAQTHDRLIAYHIQIGRDGLQQNRLLDRAQRLAARPDGCLGFSHRVHHAEASEERLHYIDRVAARIGVAVNESRGPRGGMLKARVCIARDGWTIAGDRARDLFIRRTQCGARCIQPGIDLVCGRQCLVEGLGSSSHRPTCPGDRCQEQDVPRVGAQPPLSAYAHVYVPLSPWTGPSCVTRDTAAQKRTPHASPRSGRYP